MGWISTDNGYAKEVIEPAAYAGEWLHHANSLARWRRRDKIVHATKEAALAETEIGRPEATIRADCLSRPVRSLALRCSSFQHRILQSGDGKELSADSRCKQRPWEHSNKSRTMNQELYLF